MLKQVAEVMKAEDIAWIEGASKTLNQEPIKLEFDRKHWLLKGD